MNISCHWLRQKCATAAAADDDNGNDSSGSSSSSSMDNIDNTVLQYTTCVMLFTTPFQI